MTANLATRARRVGAIQLRSWSTRTAIPAAAALGRSVDDHARELRIDALGRLMCAAGTRVLRARCSHLMRLEIRHRSAAQVRRMEMLRGLR
ncbi:hypothetical protein LRP76_01390 [Burkholderia pseudomallei]|uniref:hypothetical protein n=1 Tax=Burkholderia pseudomallei TaxID=28450 RepID=UPI001E52B9F7|nr:hypothetical protein [Burkholderia pseudomallei]CAJ2828970.1 Uncharacterised protein [Burkholderia pseudomallei]CAJ3124904.1 Uncharacterised protein [Burkholderia pseudomallei]CAJ4640809.1 Uncharacterised protein [Burkholderia pseudomallei]CAJ5047144.1 Uncharacterised protein [Burkholderia pseudomallei]